MSIVRIVGASLIAATLAGPAAAQQLSPDLARRLVAEYFGAPFPEWFVPQRVQDIVTHELTHVYHGQRNPTRDCDGADEVGWFGAAR